MILTFMANPRLAIIVRPSSPQEGRGKDVVVRFCHSLRIVEERDVDGTVVRVVKTILREGRDKPVGGTELAEASGLKRVTVLHHLRRLQELGLVERHDHRYMLRPSCLGEMMEGMRRQTMRMLSEAEEMAREIDEEFRLNERRMLASKKR